MKKKLDSDEVIETLVGSLLGDDASMREKHVCRESLRALVRLAKSEQMMEIKANVRKVSGMLEAHVARRRAKAVLQAQRLPKSPEDIQQQFEFKH